jgi:hypothetical protein
MQQPGCGDRGHGLDHVSSALRPTAGVAAYSRHDNQWPEVRPLDAACLFGLVLEKGLFGAGGHVAGLRFGHVPTRIYPDRGICRRRSGGFLVDWVWIPMHGCAVSNEAVQVSLTKSSQTAPSKPVQPIQCLIDAAQGTNM